MEDNVSIGAVEMTELRQRAYNPYSVLNFFVPMIFGATFVTLAFCGVLACLNYVLGIDQPALDVYEVRSWIIMLGAFVVSGLYMCGAYLKQKA